jgi:hypothetical protein
MRDIADFLLKKAARGLFELTYGPFVGLPFPMKYSTF